MEQPQRKVVTLKVAPDKLKAIINKPRPYPLSVFNPHAATPATPIARRIERSQQLTPAIDLNTAQQGDTLFKSATFAAYLGSTPLPTASLSPLPFASSSDNNNNNNQQEPQALSSLLAPVQETQAPPLLPVNTVMAEKESQKQPAATSAAAAPANGEGGVPFYESQRKHLQKLLEKKRKLTESLANREEAIERKETEYLESTPAGNILTGFDNYTKGTTQAAAAQRRKAGPLDQHRVFSRSSISYNASAAGSDSAATTPGSSHAPTPVSSTFGAPTPTSARTPGGGGGAPPRDRKKKGVATAAGAGAGADTGDSESDAREVKKVRTNFGAGRK